MVIMNQKLNKTIANDYSEKYQELTMEALTVSFNASLQTLYAVTEAEQNAASTNTTSGTTHDQNKESIFKKALDSIREVLQKILSAFLEKTNQLIKGIMFERYKKERDALNTLGDAFYKTIQSINFTGYFGANLDATKFTASIHNAPMNVPPYDLTNNSFKSTIKAGWADDNAFTAYIAPGLKNLPNATAGTNTAGESLSAKVKRLYNNNGETISYNQPANLVKTLMAYCDGYADGASKTIVAELNAIQNALKKQPVGENWFALIDEMFIVTETDEGKSDSQPVNKPAETKSSTEPPQSNNANDKDKKGIVDKPTNPNDPNNPKPANKENDAYFKNLRKFLNGLIAIESARMTVTESCFIDSMKQLHDIYTKGVKDGFIKQEENQTTNTAGTDNKINPA